MNLQKEHLEDLTLKDKVYHPILGEGKILKIMLDRLEVQFKDTTKLFQTTGVVGETPFISELYLQPIEIIIKFKDK